MLTFSHDVSSGLAHVSSGIGNVVGVPRSSGNTMTINLSGVTDAQRLTVTVTNVFDTYGQTLASVPVTMDVLLGDVNQNRIVKRTDHDVLEAHQGELVNQSNFLSDLTLNGKITQKDENVYKKNIGHTVP